MYIHRPIKTRNALACAAFSLFSLASLAPAGAEITIVNSATWQNDATGDLGGTFNADGTDKLVFIATGEHGFNQTANGAAGDVFYDNVQLTPAAVRQPIKAADGPPAILVDDTYNAIYFLDNPADGAGIITTTGFSSRGSVAVFSLNGTAEGVGSALASDRDTKSVELTTFGGSFVVACYGLGGTGNSAQLNSVTTPAWNAELARQGIGNNWDGHVVAYQNDVTAGTTNYAFDDTKEPEGDGRTGRHVIAVEFQSLDGTAAQPFAITDIEYDSEAEPFPTVTLTWRKASAAVYIAWLSHDLINWDEDLDDSLSEDDDERPEDAEHITVTFPLEADRADAANLFFRIEG